MRKLLPLLLIAASVFTVLAAENKFYYLSGRVKDAALKYDLVGAVVYLQDSLGQTADSCVANKGYRRIDNEIEELSYFNICLPRVDSTFALVVKCDGYTPYHFTFTLDTRKKRRSEGERLPMIYLERAPIKLGEVAVTTSKIKFYNKGDTIVYNADAFQLAEGSMLDALISQLPGVKLEEGGAITVNGEFVESLLLNGKQFLDGNNQLVLENIGAYTVKTVEVYRGQTAREKWENDSTAQRHLTMDVKLKREYNMGWIINAQGGYGTDSRYSGRLFANWFTPTTKITVLGNANNLNDTRRPGKSDSWRPELMPSGTRRYHMGAVNYDYSNPDETTSAWGHMTYEQTGRNYRSSTARTNFLSGGDTYENSFSRQHDRNIKLETRHTFNHHNNSIWLGAMAVGRYTRRDNSSATLSGSFLTEQRELTMSALEAIYSDGTPEQLAAIINRSARLSDGTSHNGEVQFFPGVTLKIPGRTHDRLYIETGFKYSSGKEERWRDYTINYGADPTPAHRRRQYFDNSPNQTFTQINNISYTSYIRRARLQVNVNYEYRFMNRDRDSYMYALDRLNDMGIFGELPSGYLDTFDPANSYTSRLIENSHSLSLRLNRYFELDSTRQMWVTLGPEFTYKHSRLDYWRDGRSHHLGQDFFTALVARHRAKVEFLSGGYGDRRRQTYANILRLQYTLTPRTPNPLDMIDVTNDADPLNISTGNPGLRTQYEHQAQLEWDWNPRRERHPLHNSATLRFSLTDNALTRGYTYDTSTGVRVNKTYNVDGNSVAELRNYFSLQFGRSEQFSVSATTHLSAHRYADMIGENAAEPMRSRVRTNLINQEIAMTWQAGKQNFRLCGGITNRHTTSDRAGFRTIDARHYSAGLTATFVIPGGLGLVSDFMLYARRGYGLRQLDTTDPIWNVRLTYTPPRFNRLTLMLDGFDMLHRLSNVSYAVSATGRTVSYTNTLPRYIMLSAQFRLNIKPPRRR